MNPPARLPVRRLNCDQRGEKDVGTGRGGDLCQPRMEEIRRIASCATVMRDGQVRAM